MLGVRVRRPAVSESGVLGLAFGTYSAYQAGERRQQRPSCDTPLRIRETGKPVVALELIEIDSPSYVVLLKDFFVDLVLRGFTRSIFCGLEGRLHTGRPAPRRSAPAHRRLRTHGSLPPALGRPARCAVRSSGPRPPWAAGLAPASTFAGFLTARQGNLATERISRSSPASSSSNPLGQGFHVPDHLDIDPIAGGAAGLLGFLPCRSQGTLRGHGPPLLPNWADSGHACGHFLGISGMLGP